MLGGEGSRSGVPFARAWGDWRGRFGTDIDFALGMPAGAGVPGGAKKVPLTVEAFPGEPAEEKHELMAHGFGTGSPAHGR